MLKYRDFSVCTSIVAVVFERNRRNCICELQNTVNALFYILGLNRGSFRSKTFLPQHFALEETVWVVRELVP